MYDIVIVSAVKDFNKIKYLYNSIIKNIKPTPNKIYCFCPEYPSYMIDNITYVLDKDVLDIDISEIKYRTNWIYQQYIKLLQNITIDNYLVIDSDVIISKPIEIYNEDKPNFLISNDFYYKSFFNYSKTLFEVDRKFNKSFICEIMLFDRKIINEMILSKFKDNFDFIKESNKIINNSCFISEYELYGNYIYTKYPDKYNYKNIKTSQYIILDNLTDTEIEEYINKYNNYDFDIINIQSMK